MIGRTRLLITLLTASAVVGGFVLPGEATPTLDGPTSSDEVMNSTQVPVMLADNTSRLSNVSNSSGSDEASEPEVRTDVDSVDRDRKSNIRVDDSVALVDYWWDVDAEVFRLTFESDRPRIVAVTESVQQPEGAGTFEIRKERLENGLTELSIPADPVGGEVAVSITTAASERQGRGVYVSTGIAEAESGPWSTTGSEAGWFGGLSVALSMMVAAAWQAKRRDRDSPEGYR